MKKCNWWRGHCFHKIPGTERKIKRAEDKNCALENDYVHYGSWADCVHIIVQSKCCRCLKEEEHKLKDFDILRAMQYPDGEESK